MLSQPSFYAQPHAEERNRYSGGRVAQEYSIAQGQVRKAPRDEQGK